LPRGFAIDVQLNHVVVDTQADLAALAGVTRKSVNAIETGRMVPSVLLALKLAHALGVAVETIFRLDGPEAFRLDL
jgi:putative transcriptional regulator